MKTLFGATVVVMGLWMGSTAGAQVACPQAKPSPLDGLWEHLGSEDGAATTKRWSEDLDGDGKVDKLEGAVDGGSGYSSATLTVRLATGESFSVQSGGSHEAIWNLEAVPDVLVRRPRLRKNVEAILFRVCPKAEGSFRRLRVQPRGAPLRWEKGKPTPATSYTIYQDDPKIIERMYGVARDWEQFRGRKEPPKAFWISYGGANHHATERCAFQALETKGDLELLQTRHGVLLYDRAKDQHAWLWVFGGGHKLRYPSAIAAEFDDKGVAVTYRVRNRECRTTVDLGTGEFSPAQCVAGAGLSRGQAPARLTDTCF
ncbi:MAG: hypothetical protein KC416_05880 [Myxococcales bacterium]|nr:hypothetical protein [Myxococcales bacterium]